MIFKDKEAEENVHRFIKDISTYDESYKEIYGTFQT